MRDTDFYAELGGHPEDTDGNNAEINRGVTQDRWGRNPR